MRRLFITASIAGLGLGCTPAQPTPDQTAAPRLELALPAGVDVTVDGVARGTTPLGLELERGPHAVILATRCATAELETTLVAGQITRLERGDAPGLGSRRCR